MKTNYITRAAVIAALYTAICIFFQPICYGPVQCRISEALCVLPAFFPAAIPGVTVGCFLSNLFYSASIPDMIFGTLATFIGAAGTFFLTRNAKAGSPSFRLKAILPPIVSNTLIIPFVLRYAYGAPDALAFLFITILAGEVISVGLLGSILMSVLSKRNVNAGIR